MPNQIPFYINWLRGSARADGWLKTTALAVFEHGASELVVRPGRAGVGPDGACRARIGTHQRQDRLRYMICVVYRLLYYPILEVNQKPA